MDTKADGRMYSRITRRTVSIITTLDSAFSGTIGAITEEIHQANLPEFFLNRFNRQMSLSRTRAYVRFLVDLQVFAKTGDSYTLDFAKRANDSEWAQSLSDKALEYIGRILDTTPDKVDEILGDQIAEFHAKQQLPTVSAIVMNLGIDGARIEEVFRWALYLYTDGDSCPFDVRQYPVLHAQGQIRGNTNV